MGIIIIKRSEKMSRDEFLRKLEKRIMILDVKERAKVIKKYEDIIDEKIAKGLTEEEAVKELGDINKVVKDILKSYKIANDYYESDSSVEGSISRFINFIVDGVRNFVSKIEAKDFHSIFEIILYILIAMFAFWVINIPFYIIKAIGHGILSIFAYPVDRILIISWDIIVNLCYLFFIIWVIVIIVNKLSNKHKTEDVIIKKKTKKEEVIKETKDEDIIERTRNVPLDIIMALIKVFIVIAILPLIFTEIGLMVAIGVIIVLIIKGVLLIGPLLVLFGLIILVGALIDLIFYLAFGRGGRR
jgi:uncharacterized membrane protein